MRIEVDKEEYDFLVWYAQNTDFGPADHDVQCILLDSYEDCTGNKVPINWDCRREEDEISEQK
jgi:hypothetical protein